MYSHGSCLAHGNDAGKEQRMLYQIENEELKVACCDFGAELHSIYGKEEQKEYLWQGDESLWNLHAPVMFPYCGRLKDFKMQDEDGTWYRELINHGFARESLHQAVVQEKDRIVFELRWKEETLKKYPYRFCLKTEYRLEGRNLFWSYTVQNEDTREMFYNVGFHPGFFCPFSEGAETEGYSIRFEKAESPVQLISDEEGQLRTGETRVYFDNKSGFDLSDTLFGKNFCLTGLRSAYVDLLEKSTGRYIRLYREAFPYMVFWSKPGKMRFLCMEPWSGLGDRQDSTYHLWEKDGILKLQPGEEAFHSLRMEFGKDR